MNIFLDVPASLDLLIAHSLTVTQIGNSLSYTTLVLIIEIETPASHSKWNVTQNGMALKREYRSIWNVAQYECHSKYMEYHSNIYRVFFFSGPLFFA